MVSNGVTPRTSGGLQGELDRMFDRFFGVDTPQKSHAQWLAPVSLWEDNDRLHIEFELPGVGKDDFELVVHDGTLRLTGERKAPEGERNYWHNERRWGKFERVIRVPETMNAESVEAQLREGLLHVTLTKRPEAQPKRISVVTE